MSHSDNVDKAVYYAKKNKSIREDQIQRLGVTIGELRRALKKDGLNFIIKDYSGGMFGDDNPFEDHPSDTYLDIVFDDYDDGPGGIDY